MPSPQSRQRGFYYGNPQNRFWRVLARVFDEPLPQTNEERTSLILHHHLALWDVLSSCTITGASDASISNPIPNDLNIVVDRAPISTIVTTGTKAAQLFKRFYPLQQNQKKSEQPLTWIALPSTSPANARMSLDALVDAYQILRRIAEPETT